MVDLEDEDADAVFGALSSTTARKIYSRLSDEPATPSDVAESIDSSIQNVRYHLEKLEDAGLIEVVDTWYSSRGNEMSVYATTDGPLIVTSDQSRAAQLREALSRYLGGVAALAGASLFVQYGLDRVISPLQSPSIGFGSDDSSGGAEDGGAVGGNGNGNGNGDGNGYQYDGGNGNGANGGTTDETDDADAADVDAQSEGEDDWMTGAGDDADSRSGSGDEVEVEAEDEEAADGGGDADLQSESPSETGSDGSAGDASGTPDGDSGALDAINDSAAEASDALVSTLPPGVLFFLGGLLVLTVVTVWWYRSTYYQR